MIDWGAFALSAAGVILGGLLIWRIARNGLHEWDLAAWLVRLWTTAMWTLYYAHQAFHLHVVAHDARIVWQRTNVWLLWATIATTLISRWPRRMGANG